MSDPVGPSVIGALFHAVMFAYQKSISKRFSKEASVVIDRNVSEFLDPVFEMDELKEVLEQDTPEKAIDKFSEFLKSQ